MTEDDIVEGLVVVESDDQDDLSSGEGIVEEVVDFDDDDTLVPSDIEDEEEGGVPDFDKGFWFIVQCFSGHEYKVQTRVQQLMELDAFKENIFRVLVPEEETVEIKNNKRVEKVTRIFPGYVFVQMAQDEHASFEIRQLPGVAKVYRY